MGSDQRELEAAYRESETKVGQAYRRDLTLIARKRDALVGKLQERYGMEKDKAEAELDTFTRSLNQP